MEVKDAVHSSTGTINDMDTAKQWFKDWFNSPYYHLLYEHRDEREAAAFIDKLLAYLEPAPEALMLDVACGKGRHAKYLADKGFTVTGIDLSIDSINAAKKLENEQLSFFQHDMRLPFRVNYFDIVFNFFTSFGYFDTQRDNDNALRTLRNALKPGGRLVLDYLNSHYVQEHLVYDEVKEKDNVVFDIKRTVSDGKFVKQISILDKNKPLRATFSERVSAFTSEDFEAMFAHQGLTITEIFGDYHFNSYDEQRSPRLILIATKS
ncbi:class I SAM-dependent methyltransferase [Chitinophaga pendula]|uniref:class I SAM-dependent methyltransferase n=1 Tax=Chitinophaga TaxID=79328 RepID=UPI000BB00BF3|nr:MULTISPECIES: class I SAM-dependent methyltransferase [Chitinophaga]ASZ11450.1 methyltransferase type 11 [Chitinophaga sp. MD30]UCJ05540.1 class I SAM-dependent methyltransferase [Chitinophaga pendula]